MCNKPDGEAEGGKSAPCDFCGGRDFEFLFCGRDYLAFSPASFNLVRCRRCRAVCLNPRPADILPYYEMYRKGAPDGRLVDFLSPDRVKLVRKLKPRGRALDIGCGRGSFLSGLKDSGWEGYGCDISPEACERATRESGLTNIYNCGAEALDLPESFFDIITFWHSLEHLERPREALEKAVRLLKDDGVLVIESPDFSSLQARFFKDRWFMLDLPRHQYQFEPANLEAKLAAAGLAVFKKDRLVNPAGTFVSFKQSLLRYAGLEHAPGKSGAGEPVAITALRRAGPLWALLRLAFDCACLAAALPLVLLRREDSFRIYCKKAVKI
ncbi:MAG: class I SAM-dependent methyltransferase [Elusimicrobia bacterium]|nr:class I SAM-dependent methyltransferase [Elusimicrobiota bacterium]